MIKKFEEFINTDLVHAVLMESNIEDSDSLVESTENRIEKFIKGNKKSVTIHYKDGSSLEWKFTGAQYGWSGKGLLINGITKTMAREFFDNEQISKMGSGEEWDAKLDRIGAELMKYSSFKDLIDSTRK